MLNEGDGIGLSFLVSHRWFLSLSLVFTSLLVAAVLFFRESFEFDRIVMSRATIGLFLLHAAIIRVLVAIRPCIPAIVVPAVAILLIPPAI